jgi:2',3'-cyclic-nucleotide 2'-phosphodiesterase (5'-nucleotidase family)
MGTMKPPSRRILRSSFLRALVCALAYGLGAWLQAGQPIHLVVLHTNDVHGQLLPLETADGPRGGLLRLGEEVRALRERLSAEGAAVLVLDGGDWTQGTPEGRVRGSVPFVGVLAAIGYDALCIGNHELDPGRGALEALLERARPPAVLASSRGCGPSSPNRTST